MYVLREYRIHNLINEIHAYILQGNGQKFFSSSRTHLDNEDGSGAELKAQEETQDVKVIDRMMTSIRESHFLLFNSLGE